MVIASPMNRLTNTAKMIFAGMQRQPEDDQHDRATVPMPLMMAPSWTVAYSSLAIGTGPVRRTARAVFAGEFEIGWRPAGSRRWRPCRAPAPDSRGSA